MIKIKKKKTILKINRPINLFEEVIIEQLFDLLNSASKNQVNYLEILDSLECLAKSNLSVKHLDRVRPLIS